MDQAENFDKSSMRLPQLAVEEWLGWIFINADANASALAPQLTNLEALMAPYGVADMVCYDTLEFDSPWNWKIMVENFMEPYHHIGGHPETLNPLYPAAGTHGVELDGAFSLLENPARDEAESAPFWVTCVFPSTLISSRRHSAVRRRQQPFPPGRPIESSGSGQLDILQLPPRPARLRERGAVDIADPETMG